MHKIKLKIVTLITIAIVLPIITVFLQYRQLFYPHASVNSLTQLRVSGNNFIDSNNQIIVLRGAARWSLEFSCGDGHFAVSDFQAMKSWGMNIVRIPLNENEFLDPTICSNNYQNTVFNAVANAKTAGLYVLLDLHWIHPVELTNRDVRGGQFPMPDNQAIAFWQTLAGKYANDPQVLFEFMNEPHSTPCNIWRDGGLVTSQGGTGWIGQMPGAYQTPGFQKFVDLIRGIGANNIIIQGASGEADLSCAVSNPLSDPVNNLAYQSHFYHTNSLGGWQNTFQALINKAPVIAGEFDAIQAANILPLFENTLKTGYIAWAWHTGEIITSYATGQPTTAWQSVHDFMLKSSLNPPVSIGPTISSTITPSNNPIATIYPTSNILSGFSIAVGLDGIGNTGDGLNPKSTGNLNPRRLQRPVSLVVNTLSNNPVTTLNGNIIYDSVNGIYTGVVDAKNLSSGPYRISINVKGFLPSNFQAIQFTKHTINNALPVTLINGKMSNDPTINTLSILDYQILYSCYGQKQFTPSCIDPYLADLNDDGVVDGYDFNLFLREFIYSQSLNTSITPTTTPQPTFPAQSITPTQMLTPTITLIQTPTITQAPITYQPGIARTPPMGADPWAIYHDNNNILNEKYFMSLADFMHNNKFPIWDGSLKTMQEIGYNYVTIDDAWGGQRTSMGLQPNLVYFPNFLSPDPNIGLIAHVHNLGLKFGLYTSVGDVTCVASPQGPIPGSLGYEAVDGAEFQKWGVDYIKIDWCGSGFQYSSAWVEAKSLEWRNALGPNIIIYINTSGGGNPWVWAAKDNSANLWRVNSPVVDAWTGKGSVMDIIDNSHLQQSFASDYHWSDTNYLEVGVGNLTLDESKSEFSMWAMATSQLIAGTDILKMHQGDITSQVIFNTEVIAIDQDPNVVQATRKATINGIEIWEKPLANNQYAIAFLNTNNIPASMTVSLPQLGLPSTLFLRDLWSHTDLGNIINTFTTASIPPHGIQVVRGK